MSNVNSVRNLYEAFAKGDVPAVLGFLDPNIE
jgi:ketosteroid isomerase-like protein